MVAALGIHGYWLFLAAGILLNLTPGQDTLFIIGRTLTGGWRVGAAAALGICVGSVGHTLAAALGLSAILATSATAFTIVKLAGAAYLIYLGARLLFGPHAAAAVSSTPAGSKSAHSVFVQGIITNLLNPKVALFFLAFLPQFIDPNSSSKTAAFLALGASFICTGLIWCLVLVACAAALQAFFVRNPGARTLLDRAVGALFLGLGARLAWSR
jgi:threonine/homoserine/homoserine lactone efflux protein